MNLVVDTSYQFWNLLNISVLQEKENKGKKSREKKKTRKITQAETGVKGNRYITNVWK